MKNDSKAKEENIGADSHMAEPETTFMLDRNESHCL